MEDQISLLRKAWKTAMNTGDIASAKELVDKNIEMYLNEDTCVLADAAFHGHLELCNWLILRRDASALWCNRWGYTVLSGACEKGHIEICKLLLEHGADTGGIGFNEPFARAIQNGHTDICKLLLQKGFKINRRKRLAMDEARKGRYLNKVERFIKKHG